MSDSIFVTNLQRHLHSVSVEIIGTSFIQKLQRGRGEKTSCFLALNVNISKTAADTDKITINDLIGSCICSFD